jgi:uncharacterized alkaline shock family protein YloU
MRRTRLHLRTPLAALLPRALTLVLSLIILWYGAMLVLLAVKVAPHTVNSLSGYRGIFDFLARLRSSDFSTHRRLAGGIGGALAFLVLIYLALHQLPRPYLTRPQTPTLDCDGGTLTIAPRVIERVAEIAASASHDVSRASGRLVTGAVSLNIGVTHAQRVAETLHDVHQRVSRDIARHELPALAVDVTVTSYEPSTGRKLS